MSFIWGKIMIPIYRLWLHNWHGPRCPKLTHSLTQNPTNMINRFVTTTSNFGVICSRMNNTASCLERFRHHSTATGGLTSIKNVCTSSQMTAQYILHYLKRCIGNEKVCRPYVQVKLSVSISIFTLSAFFPVILVGQYVPLTIKSG